MAMQQTSLVEPKKLAEAERLRACLAKMGPFRWVTVSAVKITFSPF